MIRRELDPNGVFDYYDSREATPTHLVAYVMSVYRLEPNGTVVVRHAATMNENGRLRTQEFGDLGGAEIWVETQQNQKHPAKEVELVDDRL